MKEFLAYNDPLPRNALKPICFSNKRPPNERDWDFPIFSLWHDKIGKKIYILTSRNSRLAIWQDLGREEFQEFTIRFLDKQSILQGVQSVAGEVQYSSEDYIYFNKISENEISIGTDADITKLRINNIDFITYDDTNKFIDITASGTTVLQKTSPTSFEIIGGQSVDVEKIVINDNVSVLPLNKALYIEGDFNKGFKFIKTGISPEKAILSISDSLSLFPVFTENILYQKGEPVLKLKQLYTAKTTVNGLWNDTQWKNLSDCIIGIKDNNGTIVREDSDNTITILGTTRVNNNTLEVDKSKFSLSTKEGALEKGQNEINYFYNNKNNMPTDNGLNVERFTSPSGLRDAIAIYPTEKIRRISLSAYSNLNIYKFRSFAEPDQILRIYEGSNISISQEQNGIRISASGGGGVGGRLWKDEYGTLLDVDLSNTSYMQGQEDSGLSVAVTQSLSDSSFSTFEVRSQEKIRRVSIEGLTTEENSKFIQPYDEEQKIKFQESDEIKMSSVLGENKVIFQYSGMSKLLDQDNEVVGSDNSNATKISGKTEFGLITKKENGNELQLIPEAKIRQTSTALFSQSLTLKEVVNNTEEQQLQLKDSASVIFNNNAGIIEATAVGGGGTGRTWKDQEGDIVSASLTNNESNFVGYAEVDAIRRFNIQDNDFTDILFSLKLFKSQFYNQDGNSIGVFDGFTRVNDEQIWNLEIGEGLTVSLGSSGFPRLDATGGGTTSGELQKQNGIISPLFVDINIIDRNIEILNDVTFAVNGNRQTKIKGSILNVDTILFGQLSENLKKFYLVYDGILQEYTLLYDNIQSILTTKVLVISFFISTSLIVKTNIVTSNAKNMDTTYAKISEVLPFSVSNVNLLYNTNSLEYTLENIVVSHAYYINIFKENLNLTVLPPKFYFEDDELKLITQIGNVGYSTSVILYVLEDDYLIELFFRDPINVFGSPESSITDSIAIYNKVKGQFFNDVFPVTWALYENGIKVMNVKSVLESGLPSQTRSIECDIGSTYLF
jgi:hypothetical protein